MRTEIIKVNPKRRVPDFDVIQLVESEGLVVLTTGAYKKEEGFFTGIVVSSTESHYPVGSFSDTWNTDAFKVFEDMITLKN